MATIDIETSDQLIEVLGALGDMECSQAALIGSSGLRFLVWAAHDHDWYELDLHEQGGHKTLISDFAGIPQAIMPSVKRARDIPFSGRFTVIFGDTFAQDMPQLAK